MARIVVAEDQAHIRRILVMWLMRHGHDVIEASNGDEALEYVAREGVDLLITDVNMPGMDGIELTEKVLERCPTISGVFVVTSRCDQRDLLTHLSDPRVRVHPKPFSPSQLMKEVREFVEGASPEADSTEVWNVDG
jgi:CheY-like chemotaxis protein